MSVVDSAIILDQSISAGAIDTDSRFVDRQLLTVIDNNQGSYQSGQVLFDLSTLASADGYVDMSEAVIQLPWSAWCACYNGTGAAMVAQTGNVPMGLSLKPFGLVNSIRVELDGKTIHSSQINQNVKDLFMTQATWSNEKAEKEGPFIGFSKDSSESLEFKTAASTSGIGFCNNAQYMPTAATYSVADSKSYADAYGINTGLVKRSLWTGKTADGSFYTSTTPLYNAGQSAYLRQTLFGVASHTWSGVCNVRLGDISDWFHKVPMTRGARYMLTLYVNQATVGLRINGDASPGATTISANSIDINTLNLVGSSNTTPFMIGNSAASDALSAVTCVAAASQSVTLGMGIGTVSAQALNVAGTVVSTSTLTHPIMTACRLSVPMYQLVPSVEALYLESRVKSIKYLDLYSYINQNVSASGSFNYTIANAVVNPKLLIVVPVARVSGIGNAKLSSSLVSPFCPLGADPVILYNYNVQVSGKNIYQSNQQYDYQAWLNELSLLGVNAGMSDIVSGLIGYFDWTYGQNRYYVTNLERRLPSNNSTAYSINILGQNTCAYAVDLLSFILYEKEGKLDVMTGRVDMTV
jgi:hypothetical protein